MHSDCKAWTYELADDSIKELWRADQAYKDGNRKEAVGLLASQVYARIPLIESKAKGACETQRLCYDVKPLQADLKKVAEDMKRGKPYADVNAHVFQVDKKYALAAYRSFCACEVKK